LKDCEFWSQVKKNIDENQPGINSYNLSSSGVREELDRRGGVHKIGLFFGKSPISFFSNSYLENYKTKNENFFKIISKVVPGARYLVDLSKSSERLEVLLSSNELDVFCIYLRRDPLKIFASTMQRPKRTRKWFGFKAIREAVWLKSRMKDMARVFLKVPVDRELITWKDI